MDKAHAHITHQLSEIEHRYGSQFHILAEPFLTTLLARFCSPSTHQPTVTWLVRQLYTGLLAAVVNEEFPRAKRRVDTRMIEHTDRGFVEGDLLVESQSVVLVNLARAGYLPTQICFDILNHALHPEHVRLDHIFMNRRVDADEKVVGVDISGSKIGGSVENTIVIFPDPMGATGGSMSEALKIYKEQVEGTAAKLVAVHLIVTPEHIRRLADEHPDVALYAVRLDRGMSPPDVLDTVPGARWNEESGLNELQYIVPGAGGIGEILNNAFV